MARTYHEKYWFRRRLKKRIAQVVFFTTATAIAAFIVYSCINYPNARGAFAIFGIAFTFTWSLGVLMQRW